MEKTASNWEFFCEMIFKTQKYSPYHSKGNFLDFAVIYLTLLLGLFTLSLIIYTTYYSYRQTSLIDQTKRGRYNTDIRSKRMKQRIFNEDDSEDDDERIKISKFPKEL